MTYKINVIFVAKVFKCQMVSINLSQILSRIKYKGLWWILDIDSVNSRLLISLDQLF